VPLFDPSSAPKSGWHRVVDGNWVQVERHALWGPWGQPEKQQIRCAYAAGTARPDAEPFSSPFVRWSNLDFQGGYYALQEPTGKWKYDPFFGAKKLVDAVLAGHKGAGHIPVSGNLSRRYSSPQAATAAKWKMAVKLRDKASAGGLEVSAISSDPRAEGREDDTDTDTEQSFWFGIAQPKMLGELFDLQAWVEGWEAFGVRPRRLEGSHGLDPASVSEIADDYCDTSMLQALMGTVVPERHLSWGVPLSGLVYGFPIASTVSLTPGSQRARRRRLDRR
jgi:hypothetical protein